MAEALRLARGCGREAAAPAEAENSKLKMLLAERDLEIDVMKEIG